MKNIILVNSKIIVSNHKFSYSNIRSIYTIEERFHQTINTINSIKKYIPNYYIIFIDNSDLSESMVANLMNEVDLFINPKNDDILNNDTDINETKAVGELAQIKYSLKYIDNLEFEWENLFKICGRYIINNYFNYNNYNNDHNIFKINQKLSKFKSKKCYFTSFYKISRKNYDQFKEIINESYINFKNDASLFNEPLEFEFCDKIKDKILLTILGITLDCSVIKWIENI